MKIQISIIDLKTSKTAVYALKAGQGPIKFYPRADQKITVMVDGVPFKGGPLSNGKTLRVNKDGKNFDS
jgi:hypothetical protein